MDHKSSQISVTKVPLADSSSQSVTNRFKHCDMLQLFFIVTITIAAVKIVQLYSPLRVNWLITPGILVIAAVIAKIIKRQKLFNIGLTSIQTKRSLHLLGWTCLSVLPAMFCGLLLLKHCGIDFPLHPVLPQNHHLASWLFYQFMYVAVAEELFFRGFLQGSVLTLLTTAIPKRRTLQCGISVVISAVCFAAAHMIMQESTLPVVIIAPGLILGWLYIKTDSLLAPILFHGIANASYYFMATALAG